MITKYIRYLIRDQIFTLFSIVFVIAYWVQAARLPREATRYPMVVTCVAVIFIIWNLALSIVQFRRILREQGEEGVAADLSFGLTPKKWMVIGVTLLYILLLPVVGYLTTTILYIAGLSLLLGIRRPVVITVYTVLLAGMLYAVFGLWLHVSLPAGFLI